MDRDPMKGGGNANSIESRTASTRMHGVVGESISRTHMNPPSLFAHTHSGFILMDHVCLDQCSFQARFDLSQLLMTGFDKGGNTGGLELYAEEVVKQLANASIRHSLTLDQGDSQSLDAGSILGW